ncbi:MAG: hypothetical protein ABSG37_14415 [Candidatus Limnocylindrales bacterium]
MACQGLRCPNYSTPSEPAVQAIGAGRQERTRIRQTHRNSSRTRSPSTRAGDVGLTSCAFGIALTGTLTAILA